MFLSCGNFSLESISFCLMFGCLYKQTEWAPLLRFKDVKIFHIFDTFTQEIDKYQTLYYILNITTQKFRHIFPDL